MGQLKARVSGAWVPIANGIIPTQDVYYATTTARDSAVPSPVLGQTCTVGTATGTGTALPRRYMWNGTAWQVVGWWAPAGKIGCNLTSVSTAIGAGATVYPNFSTSWFDPEAMNTGGNPSTIKIAGLYSVSVNDLCSVSSAGSLTCLILLDGSALQATNGPAPGATNGCAITLPLTVGQVIGSYTYSSIALNVTKHMKIWWIGP